MVLLPLAIYIELGLKIKNANVCIRFSTWLTCPPEKSIFKTRSNSRTVYRTTDWFQIWKGVLQGCILSLCLFNLYAVYIMQNARLDEAQVEIKIARRNINNLRYADDITLMAES